MNAHFNPEGDKLTFMAMTRNGYEEEWDIFLYDLKTEGLINLTKGNRLRDEDPKFNPVRNAIVFKQGYWDHRLQDMIYNIKELNLDTGEILTVTQDILEDSMPYYSSDGRRVYYMAGSRGTTQIRAIEVEVDAAAEPLLIYEAEGIFSYYPVVFEEYIYFTRWVDEANHSDMIVKMSAKDGKFEILPFNDPKYDFSDPHILSREWLVMSSSQPDTGGGYELYFANQITGEIYPLSLLNPQINNEKHQLGATFTNIGKQGIIGRTNHIWK
ncbi:MAG: TolB family protein [Cellulosilyticaceae bacterium]